MSKEKVRVGIIGTAFAGGFHLRAYKQLPHVEIVAAADMNAKRLNEFCSLNNIPNRHEDFQQLLKQKDIDMVSICVPNFLHAKAAIAAANAGKHIVCEKPLATNLKDAEKMLKSANDNKVKLMYAEDWAYAPASIRAREICNEGGIGDILYMHTIESHSGSHSMFAQKVSLCGGGALIHLGIHGIGCMRTFIDKKVQSVIGKTTGGLNKNLLHKKLEGEDWACAILTFVDGRVAIIEGNYVTFGGLNDCIEIYGNKGNIKVNLSRSSPLSVYSLEGYSYAVEKAETTKGWTFPAVEEEWQLGYWKEIAMFVDCVRFNQAPPRGLSGEDGFETLRIAMAIYESEKKGKEIKLK